MKRRLQNLGIALVLTPVVVAGVWAAQVVRAWAQTDRAGVVTIGLFGLAAGAFLAASVIIKWGRGK